MKRLTVALLSTTSLWLPPVSAAPVCALGMISCFLFCGSPPRLVDAGQAALALGQTEYKNLTRFDEVSAVVTTRFGKCLGINGWKRYLFNVWAIGRIDQVATSWDGPCTVDIVLENFNGYRIGQVLPSPRFIRAEVIRRVWKHLDHPLSRGDHVRIEGQLHWDGHGFLEIHPAMNCDVQYL